MCFNIQLTRIQNGTKKRRTRNESFNFQAIEPVAELLQERRTQLVQQCW